MSGVHIHFVENLMRYHHYSSIAIRHDTRNCRNILEKSLNSSFGLFHWNSPIHQHRIRHSSKYIHMRTWWSFHASNEVPSLCMHRLWCSILVFHLPFDWCFHQRWKGFHQRWEEPVLSILQCRRRQLQWWETGVQQDERTILRKAMRGTEVLPCITIQWQLYCRTIVDFGIAWHHVQRFISFPSFRNYLHHGVRKIAALGHHVCRKKADRRMKKRTGTGLVWTPGHFPVVSFNLDHIRSQTSTTNICMCVCMLHGVAVVWSEFKQSFGSSHWTMIHFGLANQSLPVGGRSAQQIRDAGIWWNMMAYVTWSRNTLTSQFCPCVGRHFHVKVAFLSRQRWTPRPAPSRWVTSWLCWCFALWACYLYGCCRVDCRKNPCKMRASRMVAHAVGLFSWDSWSCVRPGYSWLGERRFMRPDWNFPGILEDHKERTISI